jgi:CDP-4-dehydro-6-deoxyglucose reductase
LIYRETQRRAGAVSHPGCRKTLNHTVRILPADRAIQVSSDEAVLEAALRAGFGFPYSCRNGSCGACFGVLVEGSVAYPNGRPPVLSEADEAARLAVFCQARPLSDLVVRAREITEIRTQTVRVMPARVERIEDLAADVKGLWLRLPPNERVDILAGQYLDVVLRDGRRRSFSIASSPQSDSLLELHVRLCPGGRFTGYVFEALRVRDLLRIEGPLGTFFLRESTLPAILVAGGTGFAPLKAIVERHIAGGGQRELHLFWGARAEADLYLHDLACRWQSAGVLSYTPVLSAAVGGSWQGATGWVHEAVLARFPSLDACEVYMSGPPAMISAARTDFAAAGLARENLHFDAFDYAEDALRDR